MGHRDGFSFPLEAIKERCEARKPNARDLTDCIHYIQENERLIGALKRSIDLKDTEILKLKAKLYDLQNNDT
jgi:hypothetical protein